MVNATKLGYKKTLQFNLGMSVGFFIIMSLCSYFNLLLLSIIPKFKTFMSILAAGYMVYLAIKIIKSKEIDTEDKTYESKNIENNLNSFFTGMVMQFINPKVIVYGITVISNFIIPYYKSNMSLIFFSVFLAFVGLIATSCWSLFGSLFNRFLSKYRIQFNIAMGLLLIYTALSITGLTNSFH